MLGTASAFGDAAYEEPEGGNGSDTQSAAPEIDLNDPRLTSEVMDVNTEGNAYAQPALPPDGRYRVKLKLRQVEVNGQKHDYSTKVNKQDGTPYLYSALEATIIDASGKHDGQHIYDPWVGTFKNRDGSHKIQTILAQFTKPDGTPWYTAGTKMSHRDWMDLYVKALAGEPEVMVDTQWEFSCQKCGAEADKKNEKRPRGIQGMNKFPAKKGGAGYDPEMRCIANPTHGYSRAQVRIVGFDKVK
jgi:hypothetical protein